MSFKEQLKFPFSYEVYFLILSIIFGSMFIYINPPFHSNDEDRHFLHTYHITEAGLVSDLDPTGNVMGSELPVNLKQVVQSFQGVPYHMGKKLKKKDVEIRKAVSLQENNKRFFKDHAFNSFSLSYLPYLPGVYYGKSASNSPVSIGYNARFSGLIFYIICMFILIRKVPIFKSFFLVFGLTPMVLYQASSVTYDLLNYLISFSFFAAYLYYSFNDQAKVKWWTIIVFIISGLFLDTIKSGYFLIPLIVLLIPKSKYDIKGNKWIPFLILTLGILLVYSNPILALWKSSISELVQISSKSSQSLTKDFEIKISKRISNVLSDPFPHLYNFGLNLMHFKQEYLTGIIGRFGYSYSMLPSGFIIFHGMVLLLITLLDSNSKIEVNYINKLGSFAIGISTFLGVIFGFYLMSPLGSVMIFGFQGRYLIPAIPFILLIIYNNKFEIEAWKKWGSTVTALYLFLMLMYAYTQMDNLFYEF